MRTWLLSAFGDDRSYGGNLGYDDDPRTIYRYDSKVQNHKRVAAGDLALVRNRDALIGVARIAEVRGEPGTKTVRRCPVCQKAAASKEPFTCRDGHRFDNPIVEEIPCVKYEAALSDFIDVPNAVPVWQLLAACPRRAAQMSIQEMELEAVLWSLREASPELGRLLPPVSSDGSLLQITAEEAEESLDGLDDAPSDDKMGRVARSILVRRGQQRFRKILMQRYGVQCMVSGCTLLDIVEAAHIAPFRRMADHAPSNGLLLRADLHTLFDLDLMGVEPATLIVRFHPRVAQSPYSELEGKTLRVGDKKPNGAALESRWQRFLHSA